MRKLLLGVVVLLGLSSCYNKDYRIDLTYSGEQLRYISVPLGGIGTGNILVNGYGAIRDIEVFNRPSMDELPPYMTFFTLYSQEAGGEPVVRIMEREQLNEYPNPFGKPRQQLGGLPRFRESVFHNAYPVISIDLKDKEVPLEVTMSAWSPFIPVDPLDSGIPTAIIEWKLSNPGKVTTSYSIAFSMGNPMKPLEGPGVSSAEEQTIQPYRQQGWKGFTFSNSNPGGRIPDAGDFRVMFPSESELSVPLYNGSWWDDAHIFWDDFSEDGILVHRSDTVTAEGRNRQSAAMYIAGSLEPGESVTVPFLFTWHIPYRRLEPDQAFGNKTVEGAIVKNYYSQRFESIDQVSGYLTGNLEKLREKTWQFSQTMITSSVPSEVLDAAISNMAALKTNLLMQDENGNVHGFEGLGNDFGCCPGNCTHVWNYAQTMAALFPSLERNVRETGFKHATHANGYQSFRTVFPLSDNWFKNVAADGQMGNIMRVYREWKLSGDNEWLGNIWPEVKLALEFAWNGTGDPGRGKAWMSNSPVPWDPYKEGVLRGDQHNTYDINFFGPNMMTGSLYLGALKASSEMAMAMNEPHKSMEYSELYKKGVDNYGNLLWNGEYFIQQVEVIDGVEIPEHLKSPPDTEGNILPKYQYGEGCLSDQLLGQYLAFVSGMGYLMDTMMTRKALESVYKYNFREEMRENENVQRIYAANDEPGLVICSWPEDNKPLLPFVYASEVWTGVEYQVATSLIFADLVDEGLRITEAVRSRYDGSNRNPFAEIESGRYYARALASWGVYQAMSGYQYDGRKRSMKFSPADDDLPVRYFWSTADGWGSFNASRAKVELKCLHGKLELNELVLENSTFFVFREFEPFPDADISFGNGALKIQFPSTISLTEGEQFLMDIPGRTVQ